MTVRGLAARTQESYTSYVADLARYHHRSPDQIAYDEVVALVGEPRFNLRLCLRPKRSDVVPTAATTDCDGSDFWTLREAHFTAAALFCDSS